MALVAELITKLKADTKDFNSSIKAAEAKTKSFANQAKLLGTAISAFFAGAVVTSLKHIIDSIDDISTQAQKLGISTDAFQRLTYIADLSDASINDINLGMQRLVASLDDADRGSKELFDTFKFLNLSTRELKGLQLDQAYLKVAAAIAKITDKNEQLATTQRIFGTRQGATQLQIIRANVEQLGKEYDKLGVSLSEKQLQGVSDLDDRFKKLLATVSGVGKQLFSTLAPSIEKIIALVDTSLKKIQFLFEKVLDGYKKIGELSRSTTVGQKGINAFSSLFDRLAFVGRVVSNRSLDPSIVGTKDLTPEALKALLPVSSITKKIEKQLEATDKITDSTNKAASALDEFSSNTKTAIETMIESAQKTSISAELERLLGPDVQRRFAGTNTPDASFDSAFRAAFEALSTDPLGRKEDIQRLLQGVQLNSVTDIGKLGAVEELRKYASKLGIVDNVMPQEVIKLQIEIRPAKGFEAELLDSKSAQAIITDKIRTVVAGSATRVGG